VGCTPLPAGRRPHTFLEMAYLRASGWRLLDLWFFMAARRQLGSERKKEPAGLPRLRRACRRRRRVAPSPPARGWGTQTMEAPVQGSGASNAAGEVHNFAVVGCAFSPTPGRARPKRTHCIAKKKAADPIQSATGTAGAPEHPPRVPLHSARHPSLSGKCRASSRRCRPRPPPPAASRCGEPPLRGDRATAEPGRAVGSGSGEWVTLAGAAGRCMRMMTKWRAGTRDSPPFSPSPPPHPITTAPSPHTRLSLQVDGAEEGRGSV
jgi:hypothetical protein